MSSRSQTAATATPRDSGVGQQRRALEQGGAVVGAAGREGEVVVVDEVEVGARRQVDGRALALHLDGRERGALQPVAPPSVGADGEHVRAGRALRPPGVQHQRVAVALQGQPVGAGLLQPALPPRVEVAAARLRQRVDEVLQRGAAPRVAGEVVGHPAGEGLLADVRHQLVQDRRALGVGDRVEDGRGLGDVGDGLPDGVRGGALVGEVGAQLLAGEVAGPDVGVGRGAHGGPVRGELGEGLVQPEVVPPAHRHDVAEPHVRHLVQQHPHQLLLLGRRRGRPLQEVVGPGDAAVVLHRPAELRDEHLVVAALRERHPEGAAEEGEPLRGHAEQLGRVPLEQPAQRAPGVHAEVVPVRRLPQLHERSGVHDRVVGRQRRGVAEGPAAGVGAVGHVRVPGVAQHRPGRRGRHRERVRGLEVGLVEAGPGVARLVRLEGRPQVDLAVGRVDRAVDALAAGGVGLHGDHPQHVRSGSEPVERDPPVLRGRQGGVVEGGLHDVGSAVDERVAVRSAAEADGRHGAQLRAGGQAGQVEVDVVALHLEQQGARLRLGDGQAAGHGCTLALRPPAVVR